MKLLLDQNISSKLVQILQPLYPESAHVKDFNLERRQDQIIWAFAKNNGFFIVTRDADFFELGLLKGSPPKIIWIQTTNPSKQHLENILMTNKDLIQSFAEDSETFCLRLL